MSFTKRTEDFVCERCGATIKGSGYTNHCPKCLWSKHVDNDPGDRANQCGGMMEAVAIEGSSPNYRIVHRCTKCGTIKRVATSVFDDQAALIAVSGKDGIMGA